MQKPHLLPSILCVFEALWFQFRLATQRGRLAPPLVPRSRIVQRYFALPILYMPVPQVGHTPLVAGLPFFIVTAVASFISR